MKVQLEIDSKVKGSYKVKVFKIVGANRIFDCFATGTIPEILSYLSEKYDEQVVIEKSLMQGWY